MATKTREQIKRIIDENVFENSNGAITGLSLNQILKLMVDNGGIYVEPNPIGVAQRELETIKIENTIYVWFIILVVILIIGDLGLMRQRSEGESSPSRAVRRSLKKFVTTSACCLSPR